LKPLFEYVRHGRSRMLSKRERSFAYGRATLSTNLVERSSA